MQDSNRGTLKELRRRVDTETLGVLQRVRTMQAAATAPAGKGNGEKAATGGPVVAGVGDPAAVPSGGKPAAAEQPPLS